MQLEVKIGALIMDPNSNTPIVVLKGVDSENILPIWVGAFEANAIALEIEKIVPQRPMTHDLIRNFIAEIGYSIERIVISDLKDNTFFAVIGLKDPEGNSVLLDARPSDAIALALRTDCPIFVEEEVFEISGEAGEDPNLEGGDATPTVEEWPDLIH